MRQRIRKAMRFRDYCGRRAKRFLARRSIGVSRLTELTRLADTFGSDKGTQKSAHLYTRVYEKLFEPFRDDQIALLEIGLLRSDVDARRELCAAEGETDAQAYQAPSLQMWRAYFPKADLFGFDIDDFSNVKIDRCRIFRGDMSRRDDLVAAAKEIGKPIDILIEDGGHVSHHQQIALGALFPFIRSSGGMYIIEDLHWQNPKFEKCSAPKTRDLCRQLQVNRNFKSPFLSDEERMYIQDNTASVRLYDSFTREVEDPSDAIAVLMKT
jgi:hypothetical protein